MRWMKIDENLGKNLDRNLGRNIYKDIFNLTKLTLNNSHQAIVIFSELHQAMMEMHN